MIAPNTNVTYETLPLREFPILSADMDATNAAELHAKREYDTFYVRMTPRGSGWYFDADAARNAAKFFNMLARDLERHG